MSQSIRYHAHHAYHPSKQNGQALVLGLSLCAVAILGWLLSFNIGQLVHDKLSLLRAADAAILSAATIQARAMNAHAYLNRAQLAHQLAMTHLVTLASQERLRATQARQSTIQNPPAFLIGMFFGPTYASAYLSARAGGLDDTLVLQQLEDAFGKHDALIQDVIARTRQDLLQNLHALRKQVFETVLIHNVGDNGSAMRGTSLQQLGLTYQTEHDELDKSLRELNAQSPEWQSALSGVTKPYGFLRHRNHTKHNYWAVNIRCPHKRHALRRRGHTEISQDGVYEASDSLSFHAIRSNKIIGCYEREYPMGWAVVNRPGKMTGQNIDSSGSQNFAQQSFWRWVAKQSMPGWDIFNGSDNQLASQWAHMRPIRWSMKQAVGYADLTSQRDKPLYLEVQIQQSANKLGMIHARSRIQTLGRFNVQALNAGDSIQAHVAAETYFERPEHRKDQQFEQPSLFQPYWNARLVRVQSKFEGF
jgi:hypothetical protein